MEAVSPALQEVDSLPHLSHQGSPILHASIQFSSVTPSCLTLRLHAKLHLINLVIERSIINSVFKFDPEKDFSEYQCES